MNDGIVGVQTEKEQHKPIKHLNTVQFKGAVALGFSIYFCQELTVAETVETVCFDDDIDSEISGSH